MKATKEVVVMKTVMICDDSMFMRMILRNTINDLGFEIVAEAIDGEDAVRKYAEYKPDFVTMDITMPGMDGVQAVKAIIGIHPDAKIVMVSALGQQSTIIEALQVGAKDFIVKPFQLKHIGDAFNALL